MPRMQNWVPLVLTATAVGVGVYLLTRPRAALPAPVPGPTPLPPPGLPPPVLPPPGSTTTTTTTTTPPAITAQGDLEARLRASADARRIFATQSLLYSSGFSNLIPTGVESPEWQAQVDDLARITSFVTSNEFWFVKYADLALHELAEARSPRLISGGRLLPFTLSQDLVDLINRDAGLLDPQWPMLQIRPRTQAPAGAVAYSARGSAHARLQPAFVSMRD